MRDYNISTLWQNNSKRPMMKEKYGDFEHIYFSGQLRTLQLNKEIIFDT